MKRIRMTHDLSNLAALAPLAREITVRGVSHDDDRDALGALLYLAYLGGPDQEENNPDEGRREIDRTIDGAYGPFIASASFVASDPEGVVGASLVTRFEELPLLAHLIVHPRIQRRGLGAALALRSLEALAAHNERVARLAVHPESPARGLYARLGFVEA
ncbi:MAG: GNAT family N-acetyltransferase [Myxococcales bacterium]|nr:GNAT family N-acetyltransferase [Myxococcales bacterium]